MDLGFVLSDPENGCQISVQRPRKPKISAKAKWMTDSCSVTPKKTPENGCQIRAHRPRKPKSALKAKSMSDACLAIQKKRSENLKHKKPK